VVGAIRSSRKRWVDFMVKFALGLAEPDPRRARNSALTIALSYVAGGLIPLTPYFFWRAVQAALMGSVLVTVLALFVFGFIKGRVYHQPSGPECLANRAGGRSGSRSGLSHRSDDRVVSAMLSGKAKLTEPAVGLVGLPPAGPPRHGLPVGTRVYPR
jgi:hypothetical protein